MLQKPVVAFSGRSNVGKSSLLNRLIGKAVAPVSSQPGRTRAVWLYETDDPFLWADMPGYGYATVSQAQRQSWLRQKLLFLEKVRPLICVLVDSRHPPQRLDIEWVRLLEHLGLPYAVLATKADKLSQSERHQQRRVLLGAFPKAIWKGFISARSEEGLPELKIWIRSFFPG
ncbi:MAG: ribosome biogenesis GTP-binding protein YihA/YsxC [Bacteroidia bacterium]|nr:ribosome biogenesis GTP-binding protein YihA/YsxC [Bacteroidia bacterium]